ncbi:hypothetical protein IWX47DRAFT_299408 [Phyllosticta citricarpa]
MHPSIHASMKATRPIHPSLTLLISFSALASHPACQRDTCGCGCCCCYNILLVSIPSILFPPPFSFLLFFFFSFPPTCPSEFPSVSLLSGFRGPRYVEFSAAVSFGDMARRWTFACICCLWVGWRDGEMDGWIGGWIGGLVDWWIGGLVCRQAARQPGVHVRLYVGSGEAEQRESRNDDTVDTVKCNDVE